MSFQRSSGGCKRIVELEGSGRSDGHLLVFVYIEKPCNCSSGRVFHSPGQSIDGTLHVGVSTHGRRILPSDPHVSLIA